MSQGRVYIEDRGPLHPLIPGPQDQEPKVQSDMLYLL